MSYQTQTTVGRPAILSSSVGARKWDDCSIRRTKTLELQVFCRLLCLHCVLDLHQADVLRRTAPDSYVSIASCTGRACQC